MKKPVVIVAVLIVLVLLIGFERLGQGLRFLVSDERSARTREDDRATGSEVTQSKTSSTEESESTRIASRSYQQGVADSFATAPTNEHSDPQSVAIRVTGEISPIQFIRASTIIGNSSPSKEQIHRLSEALAVIGNALRPSAVIFDLDAVSSSGVPVLLFARDRFDLTIQVKAIYDKLEKSSNYPPQAISKVEQGGGGNSAALHASP